MSVPPDPEPGATRRKVASPVLRLTGEADGGDLAAFLGRALALDPAAVVRLRTAGGLVTAWARLPFGVLVSRTVGGDAKPTDVTVGGGELLGALESAASPAELALPRRRDVEWRTALPPAAGWVRLDEVPGDVVRSLVRAGAEALRSVPAGVAASAGESLLDHESLTVSGPGGSVALPLRVLTALVRMGFLAVPRAAERSGSGDAVLVATGAGWVRLAAPYGSAYQHAAPSLGLALR